MVWFQILFAIAVVVASSYYFFRRRKSSSSSRIGGFVSPGYEGVKAAFEANFASGWDSKGAAFSVYRDGVLVVDLYGGFANAETFQTWEDDTIANIFSCGKGVVAIAVAMLVDRGYLKYDAFVKDYWPEFGCNGKEKITVEMLLSHQGGLEKAQFKTTFEDIGDHERMSKLLSDMTPTWPPGTAQGYHTYTYGWLADQLIRRVDPGRRSAGRFIKEELTDPLGVDFYIGLPPSEFHRKAFAYKPGIFEFVYGLKAFFIPLISFLLQVTTKSLLPWELTKNIEVFTNNPRLLTYEIPAANGVASSKALARIWDIVANNGVDVVTGKRFLSSEAVDQLYSVKTDRFDRTIRLPMAVGPGTMIRSGLFHSGDMGQVTTAGHAGFGGQYAHADRERRTSVAFLSNKLHMYIAKDPRFMNLVQAVYDS